MKRLNRVMLVLLVAAILLVGFTGCGDAVENNQSELPEKEQTPNGQDSNENEPVTLKLFIPAGSIPITTGIQDDPVAKEIEKVIGVILDVEPSSGTDKLQVMVASGDLADITMIGIDYVEPLIKAENITQLDQYVENAPNIQKNAKAAIQYSKDVLSNGTGNLYVLPSRAKETASPVADDYDGVFMRWDYYKELGKPEINNVDDLIRVVAKMVDNHPTNEDGKKNYGFQTFLDWGSAWAYGSNSYTQKYSGLYMIGSSYGNHDMVNNKYIPLLDDKNKMWKGAEMYNKAYRAGILDPESFTQKYENAQQKSKDGRILCQFQEWMVQDVNISLAKSTGGTATYVDIPMQDTEEYTAWYDRKVPFGMRGRMMVVSAKSRYPQKAVDVIDYLFSEEGARTILTGAKGRTWTEENGRAKVMDEALKAYQDDPDFRSKEGIHKYEGMTGLDYDSLAENGQFLDLFLEPDITVANYTLAEKEYIQHFGAETKLGVIAKRQHKTTMDESVLSLMPILTPELLRIKTKLDDYISTEFPKLIMTESDKEYQTRKEKMFKDIENLDYEEIKSFEEKGYYEAIEKAKALSNSK